MQTKPTQWDDILQSASHSFEFKAVINGKEYHNPDIWSASIHFPMMDKLAIGTAPSASLNITLAPDGEIPTGAEIKCYLRVTNGNQLILVASDAGDLIKTDDGYVLASTYPQTSGWLPFGTYYIDTRSIAPNGRITITAYDAIMKAEQNYIDNSGAYPMQMADAVDVICGMIGVELDTRSQIAPYTIDSPTGVYTIREVLCGIAAASGANAVITKDGKLLIRRLESPSAVAESPAVDCSVLSADMVTVGKITLYPDSDVQYTSGTSGYEIQADCQYATQAICDYVKSILDGVTYLPFSASTVYLDPALELGDSVKINGNLAVLADISYTVGAAMTASVGAAIDEELNHEYPYQTRSREQRKTAAAFSEIRKTTEEIRLSVEGKADSEDVQTAINLNLNALSLSYSAGENGASITLSKDGVKITGDVKIGSIDASKIDVKNLNADEITAGTLSAIDIVGCTIYAQESKQDYAKMLSNGMEIYTDGTYKMGLYVEGSNPTLELGNTTPAFIQKIFEDSAHKLWLGNRTGSDGIMIDFTNHTVKKYINGTATAL